MTYRILEVCEWELITPAFEERGVLPPDPRFAFIVGAFDDEKRMHGFLVFQLQFHAEPLVAQDPFVIRGLLRSGEQELLNRVGACNYFSFAADGNIAGICEALGMRQTNYLTYHKTLYPVKLN